ncbi:MAG: hypothetical protein NT113_10385 [Hyphomicrobiales bacterium]|jgi:hypothetical protein|nr:hypothetical protein [Hyphomicrobiales bacterium]
MPENNDVILLQRAESLEDLRYAYNAITANLAPGETLEDRLEEAGCFFVFGECTPSGHYWSYDNERLLIERDGKFVIVDRDDADAETLTLDHGAEAA